MNNWYETLIKPPLLPPPAVFSIVWTILYILMALSFIFYVIKDVKDFRDMRNCADLNRHGAFREKRFVPYVLFFAQLGLNFAWTYVFFKMHLINLASFMIFAMIVLVIWVIVLFWKKSKIAAWLLVPYLAWLFAALYFNFAMAILN